MVFLRAFPGVEVVITINGVDLTEHQETELEEEPKTVTRYIELISDAYFTIRIKATPGVKFKSDCIVFAIHVDGIYLMGRIIEAKDVKLRACETHCDGVQISDAGDTKIRKFKFSPVETVAEHGNDLRQDRSVAARIGEIKVEVTHRKIVQRNVQKRVSVAPQGPRTLSEKALKGQAISHSISLSNSEPVESSKVSKTLHAENVDRETAATYVFKYRSRKALQELMIIPRTPSPVPLEDRPEEELNLEEARQLLRELKADRARSVRIKQEREPRGTSRKIKREHEDENPRPRKQGRSSGSVPLIEFDDDGTTRESSVLTMTGEQSEVIELD